MTRPSVSVESFEPVANPGLDNDPMTQLVRVFVYFLQNLFRCYPEGSGMQWKPTEEHSEMIITGEKPEGTAIEKRPHITCVLGSMKWSNLGLDQMQITNTNTGERTHTDLVPSTATYHCQAKNGTHAKRIAWNASQYTTVFRRIIMRGGGLHNVGTQHALSPEGPITQFTGPTPDSKLVEVQVTIPFYWQPQWRIRRAAEIFNGMELNLNTLEVKSLYSAGRAMAVRPPMVKGVPVNSTPIDPPGVALTQRVLVDEPLEEE